MPAEDRYNETLYAQVLMGDQAEEFFRTDLGRYILGHIEQEVADYVELLKHADPSNISEIIRLQSAIKVAESVPKYFAELIQEGRQALQIMEEGDD